MNCSTTGCYRCFRRLITTLRRHQPNPPVEAWATTQSGRERRESSHRLVSTNPMTQLWNHWIVPCVSPLIKSPHQIQWHPGYLFWMIQIPLTKHHHFPLIVVSFQSKDGISSLSLHRFHFISAWLIVCVILVYAASTMSNCPLWLPLKLSSSVWLKS